MHIFYQKNLDSNQLELTEDESKHAIRVLRLKKGDELQLTDGKGTHAIAIITNDNPKKCELEITRRNNWQRNRNYTLNIIVAPTKNMERIEWFIEKAVEIGIDDITFIETENSERIKINMERCEKIAISAMKQSKQWFLPKIHPVQKLSELLQKNNFENNHNYIAWCEVEKTQLLSTQLSKLSENPKPITILIGPEGDFTASEVKLAQQIGFIPVSLGNNILRTETAALFACMNAKIVVS